MKVKDIRKIETDKLGEMLVELKNKTREFRFSITNNQMKNVREVRVVKKDIAKIMTVLNERTSQANKK